MRKEVCKSRKCLAEKRLIALMRRAHAGERAAALAYQGHAAIAVDPGDRSAIRTIESDEWRHRDELRSILLEFGAGPSRVREFAMMIVGRTVSIGCYVCGFAIATYFAAVLEASNVAEYDLAADLAFELSRPDLQATFHRMARTEEEHERLLSEMLARTMPGQRPAVLTRRMDRTGREF